MGSTYNNLQSWLSPTWTDASLAASVTGPATNKSGLYNMCVQIICGAGATGTFAIQENNTKQTGGTVLSPLDQGPVSTAWVTKTIYDGAAAPISLAVAGSAATLMLNFQSAATYIRVIYTRTSGTGTANVWISGNSM